MRTPLASIAGACAVAFSAAASAGLTGVEAAQPPAAQRPDAPQPFRVRVLAAGERTSLVIELDHSPDRVKYDRIDSSNGILEVGPIAQAITPRELKADPGVPLLVSVSVRPGSSAVRLHLNFLAGSRATVRTVGKRVYVDLAAAPAPSAASTPAAAAAAVSRGEAAPPVSRVTVVDDLSSLSYEQIPASVAEAASALAKRPDINGLLALRARVVGRDNELGHRAPDVVSRVLADLDERLDEARRLRLKMDALEFERAGRGQRR